MGTEEPLVCSFNGGGVELKVWPRGIDRASHEDMMGEGGCYMSTAALGPNGLLYIVDASEQIQVY